MKTLYGILGVCQEATPHQIEQAYTRLVASTEVEMLVDSERRNRLVALSEAYRVLADPISRQSYDAKLASAHSSIAYSAAPVEGGQLLNRWTILLVGVLFLGGIYLYAEKAKERDRLRIEHEHEVEMKRLAVDEERQRHEAEMREVAENRANDAAVATQRRLDEERFERGYAQQQRLELQRQQLENQSKLEAQRAEAQRQRQEQLLAQQRLQADKRHLQQLEREHYGKVITY